MSVDLRPSPLLIALPRECTLDLSAPRTMGVLNVTPDSFSDGGEFVRPEAAVARALAIAEEGAAVLDVGGESTRPGARSVQPAEELSRVLPVIEALIAQGYPLPISIDTRRASVARAALAAGAHLVNDVTGLQDPEMACAVAEAGAGLVIGHIRGTPETMQKDPRYQAVVDEVEIELLAARARALSAGVAPERILLDPGIGFGKLLEHNLALLAALPRLAQHGPVVIGVSRKSMLGALLGGRPARDRAAGGIGAAVFAALRGASLLRTHDVAATTDALRVAWALEQAAATAGEGPRVA